MSLKQPVQYPVKYYSHLDADAPQLADADGVIKTILKACLVTGYGTKESAGWTSLFEDVNRIVLRRPLGTGNPPDIKIENGVINGVASHRIVSQDNPTGLDYATELASVNLLARDSQHGNEWHLIVSDFGFIFYYQMDGTGRSQVKSSIVYCGSLMRLRDSDDDFFMTNEMPAAKSDGTASTSFPSGFFNSIFKNARLNTSASLKYLEFTTSELSINNDYAAQRVFLGDYNLLPFYKSLSISFISNSDRITSIDNRPFLRLIPQAVQSSNIKGALYIPLDYWEL